jgi:hypothetical protein
MGSWLFPSPLLADQWNEAEKYTAHNTRRYVQLTAKSGEAHSFSVAKPHFTTKY